jgi:hypothetical protein
LEGYTIGILDLGSSISMSILIVFELGLDACGSNATTTISIGSMLVIADSKAKAKPNVRIPSFAHKKRENLKLIGLFRGAMIPKNTCNHNM